MGMFRTPGGGGFLNNQNGTITGYALHITDWPARAGKKAYRTLSVELQVHPDGRDNPVPQFIKGGFVYEGVTVSKDGLTLLSKDTGPIIDQNSEFAKLVTSMVESGFESFDEEGRNFEPMIGQRFTFIKAINVAEQMAAGRKALKGLAKTASDTEIMQAGKVPDKKDKTKGPYNRQMLLVSASLGEAETTPAPKRGATKTTKTAAKAQRVSEDEQIERAEEVLLQLLEEAKGHTFNVSRINRLVTTKAVADNLSETERDSIRTLLQDSDILERQNGWEYDAETGALSLALVTA